MRVNFLTSINWEQPWLAPYRAIASAVTGSGDWRSTVNTMAAVAKLHNNCGLPVRFVPQENLPANTPYEKYINVTGCVPTRENLHDFFNALVWLSFPRIKVQLNALQAEEIQKASVGMEEGTQGVMRGKVRDAATIFDENAALLVTSDVQIIDNFRGHQWNKLFVEGRDHFSRSYEVWLFGHALMEKLVTPFKAITAHAWPIMVERDFFALTVEQKRGWLDLSVAEQIREGMAVSRFTPLPVLGLPGWSDKQDPEFYADTSVFRPRRVRA